MKTIVLLPGDEPRLERFLVKHADSSMLLRSNALGAGLAYQGKPFEGVYVGAVQGDELVAVAAHYWNGNVILQTPVATREVVQALIGASGRPLSGLVGPARQVTEATRALDATDAATKLNQLEVLYAISLQELHPPELPGIVVRRAERSDVEVLSQWRHDYAAEALGETPGPALLAETKKTTEAILERRDWFVATRGTELLSCAAYNAKLPDMVQVGGVWTPHELRGRRYAQAAVAGLLKTALDEGASRSVLFTGVDNAPAKRAYEAIGYRPVGDYALRMFRAPLSV